MVILFLLFLVQFSVACACLAVNSEQQELLAKQASIFISIARIKHYSGNVNSINESTSKQDKLKSD